MKKILPIALILGLIYIFSACENKKESQKKTINEEDNFFKTSKPYTRWWWFADIIKKEDIASQLDFVKNNNFGGVEIAWVYPLSRKRYSTTDTVYTPRYDWLSKEWSDIVTYTKKYCDSIGIGCDFTFGTGWPFGDSYVSLENSTQVYGNTNNDYKNTYSVSWEYPRKGYILNHLSKKAFDAYSKKTGGALAEAFKGSKSCIFCDSWEVETRKLWTDNFDKLFKEKYGYDIIPFMENLYDKKNSDIHYDYMKLISELVINNFYIPFTNYAKLNNSYSRSQCSGAPVDIISAYATQDVPESEAMLYEPSYSQIVSSAAILSGKKIVSSETFTCTYGFPYKDSITQQVNYRYRREEQAADLKLVSDALFANGVNHIIWHGMPFNPKGIDTINFYATVHVGSAGKLSNELKSFNQYIEKVQNILTKGKTYTDIAVYIPQEDAWIGQEMDSPDKQMPWAWGDYEMRNVVYPSSLKGYHPTWINTEFLKKASLKNNLLTVGDAQFSALYVDVEYIDLEGLSRIAELAVKDFPIYMSGNPKQPGKNKSEEYQNLIIKMKSLKNVSDVLENTVKKKALVEGENLPDYICKIIDDEYYLFFANPKAKGLTLPLKYGQSFSDSSINKAVTINISNKVYDLNLKFEPYQSIMLKINKTGGIEYIDIKYIPNTPNIEQESEK